MKNNLKQLNNMKRISYIILIALFSFTASAQSKTKPVSDSAQIRSVVMNFYNWYNSNWGKINAFKLYKGKKTSDGFLPPYKIDWKEVDRYFAYLRKNVPYVGEAFIVQERKHFRWADSMFKKEPDGEIPAGFDYDRFTNSQEEPEYLLKELKNKKSKWTIKSKKNSATVVVQNFDAPSSEYLQLFCAEMIKEKGKWKISKPYCPDEFL